MNTTLTDDRYALIQRYLHWIIAVLVLGMLISGWIMHEFKSKDFPKGVYSMIYDNHKSIGVIVLVLMTIRIITRLAHGAPAPHPSLATWQRVTSGVVHYGFYILLIAQPVIGLIGTWSFPAPVPVLDSLGIDNPFSKDRDLSKLLFYWHDIIGRVLAAFVVLHIAGAVSHILKRDGIFRRMGFGK